MTDKEKIEWRIERWKLKDLKGLPNNPRVLTKHMHQELKKSLEEDGNHGVLKLNADGTIIGGNQRAAVLKEIGEKEVDVKVATRQLSDLEVQRVSLRDNKVQAEFDHDILANLYDPTLLVDCGFTPEEMGGFNPDEVEQIESEEGDDETPEPPKEPETKKGDLYELGEHRLICGDSTMIDDVQKVLNGELVDLVLTDPPYNVDYGAKAESLKKARPCKRAESDIQNDNMDNNSFRKFLYDVYLNMFTVMKEGAPIYVFHADSESVNFREALKDAGLKLSETLVWLKHHFSIGRQDYHYKHEPILYGWKEGEAHKWYSDRKQTTILEFDKPASSSEHPTMKPINILLYLLQNSSQKGDVVWDSFLGSGSTLIACEKLKRRCMGLELEPKYCDVIVKRWVDFRKKNGQDTTIKRNGEIVEMFKN